MTATRLMRCRRAKTRKNRYAVWSADPREATLDVRAACASGRCAREGKGLAQPHIHPRQSLTEPHPHGSRAVRSQLHTLSRLKGAECLRWRS